MENDGMIQRHHPSGPWYTFWTRPCLKSTSCRSFSLDGLSDITVELVYARQLAKTTQGLISSIRTGRAPVLSLKTTIRDLRSLGLLIDPKEESAWANGLDIDQMMVATPAHPETTTTETNPLENEVDGEASNTEANTANADTNKPLDNEV